MIFFKIFNSFSGFSYVLLLKSDKKTAVSLFELISKLLKSRQMPNLRPAKGAFSAVTFQVATSNYLLLGCGFAI